MIVLTKQRRGAVNASSGLGLNRAHLYKTKGSRPKNCDFCHDSLDTFFR